MVTFRIQINCRGQWETLVDKDNFPIELISMSNAIAVVELAQYKEPAYYRIVDSFGNYHDGPLPIQ